MTNEINFLDYRPGNKVDAPRHQTNENSCASEIKSKFHDRLMIDALAYLIYLLLTPLRSVYYGVKFFNIACFFLSYVF